MIGAAALVFLAGGVTALRGADGHRHRRGWYELAAEIDPEDPGPHLGLARVHARSGNRKAALDALRAAAALGLRIPRQRLVEDPELAQLRGDPAFDDVLTSLPLGAPAR